MHNYDYYKNALHTVPKPCAFLNHEAFTQNINDIAASSNQKQIRIATKSVRSVSALKEIEASSPVYQGFMCFTAEEALYLQEHGFDDLLIAYPVWDSVPLQKICKLVQKNYKIIVMVDSLEHIKKLEHIAEEANSHFLVCIDVDLSSNIFGIHFGVHRSPIKTTEQALAIVKRISDSAYLQLDGMMGYEAQIAGVTDNDPTRKAKNVAIRYLKKRSSGELIKKRKRIMDQIKELGISLRFINGGGTGSLHQTSLEDHVTEVTVGSGFFNSHLFDNYQAFKRQPAAGFAIEITRIPKKHIYTCFGGGYIASGPADKDKLPQVFLPKGARLISNEGAGEVQTPIFYNGEVSLGHGDPVIMRHSKSGELCERFQCLYIIKNGEIIGNYSTYRGDQQCFL